MLEKVVAVVEEAGRRIMEVYRSADFETEYKSDSSPVTRADLESHRWICGELQRSFEIPVLSEEEEVPTVERLRWKRFWLVDPLDGTKNFLARDGQFTVNVALIDDGRPILGVVGQPESETVYCAERGGGAQRRQRGASVSIGCRSAVAELVGVVSVFHQSEATREFLKQLAVDRIEAFGSALKICKVAEGAADVYPRLAPTMEWDTAAGHCVLAEAGGRLIDLTTRNELSYNKKSLVNNWFAAVGRQLELPEVVPGKVEK